MPQKQTNQICLEKVEKKYFCFLKKTMNQRKKKKPKKPQTQIAKKTPPNKKNPKAKPKPNINPSAEQDFFF